MEKVRLRSAFACVAAALLSALTAPGVAAEAEKPDNRAAVRFGLNGVPSQDPVTDRTIAEEFQLDFFTTIFQWKEPEQGAYSWKEIAGVDPFKQHLQSLKQQGYAVSLTNTTVHMDQKHLPKYLEGKRFDDPELLERWGVFLRAFLAEYGDSIDFLNLGNEVGSYFGGHREEWKSHTRHRLHRILSASRSVRAMRNTGSRSRISGKTATGSSIQNCTALCNVLKK
ncbi:MAG: hypothetical protein ACYC3X_16210 [Pirellulaceae bacterium]